MNAEDFETLIVGHCQWMEQRNYSTLTVKHRRQYLRAFANWCIERAILRPLEVNRQVLRSYQRHLFYRRKTNGQPLSASTQQGRLVCIKTYFRWLTRNDYIGGNPASELEMPRKAFCLPRNILSAQEVEQILSLAHTNEPLGLRDRAILETLYSTGIRRMELANLKIWDIDFARGLILVRLGKGRKDRYVPIGERALLWVRKYIQESRQRLKYAPTDEGALYLTQSGKAFSPDEITNLVRKYIQEAQIGKVGSAHLLRHTMATLMLENGADIRYVQEMLGHARLATTQIYTHVAINKLKEIHTATHPAKLDKTNPIEDLLEDIAVQPPR